MEAGRWKVGAGRDMSSLCKRALDDFQFDLENARTMSQLTRKSTDERIAATLMIDVLKNTDGKTAAEVAGKSVTDQAGLSGSKVLFAVSAADTAGRARAMVREGMDTRSGAWA